MAATRCTTGSSESGCRVFRRAVQPRRDKQPLEKWGFRGVCPQVSSVEAKGQAAGDCNYVGTLQPATESYLQQLLAEGERYGLRAIGDTELREERSEVFLHHGPAYAELAGDIRI